MFPVFVLIFLLVPVIEIYILIQVGQVIGALWTIVLVVLTAIIGVRLLKLQGMAILMRAQQKMQTGEMPAQEMMEGIGIVVAGAFLLTPGFVTDVFGFILLIPPTRTLVMSLLLRKFMQHSHVVVQPFNQSGGSNQEYHTQGEARKPDVIEGVKYKREN